jgi:internalin A
MKGDTMNLCLLSALFLALPQVSDLQYQETPIDAVARLGGTLVREKKAPDAPVIELLAPATGFSDQDARLLLAFPKLKRVDLAYTKITDATLRVIGKLADLEELDIRHTSVKGSGLKDLGAVRKINLRGLALDESIVDIARLSHVHTIILSNSTFRIERFPSLDKLNALRIIDLESTPANDRVIAQLAGTVALQTLRLGSTKITDVSAPLIAKLTRLEELDLQDTNISDAFFGKIGKMQQLRILNLAGTSVSDAGLPRLAQFPNIEELSLWNTKVGGGMRSLAMLPKLRSLNLNSVRLTREDFKQLNELTKLRWLDLTRTGFDSVDSIRSLSGLHTLRIGNNKLTDASFNTILQFKTLEILDLQNNDVSDQLVDRLVLLPKLREVNVSGTKISADGTARIDATLAKRKQ